MTKTPSAPLIMLGLTLGCPFGDASIGDPLDDEVGSESGSDTDTGSEDDVDDSSSTDSEADSGGEVDSTTETGAEPFCGDGNVDPGEFCDDGNLEGLDGCNAHCTKPGIALWSRVFDSEWGALGTAAGDVDGSIYFYNRFDGLHGVDHGSGEPSELNSGLEIIRLSSQAPGRLVGLNWSGETVVGIETTGEVLWTRPMTDDVQSFAVDGMGNVITLDEDGTLTSIDVNGASNWQTPAPPLLYAVVAADPAGIYIVGGAPPERWLYGLDADGVVAWQTLANFDGDVIAVAAGNGQIAMVGAVDAPPFGENHHAFSVRTYDSSNGQLLWSDQINGPGDSSSDQDDVGQCVAFDAAGNVLVAGTLTLAPDSNALWVARYSPGGTLLWSETLDDGILHYCESLTALPDGDVLVSEAWYVDQPQSGIHGRLVLFMP